MPLTDQQVKTSITIGKYGGCLPACSGSLILGRFNLSNCDRVIVRKIQPPLEGGTIPMVPGEIQDLYQPVPDQDGWWTRVDDVDPFKKPKRLVQVQIKIKDKTYDKHMLLSERASNMAVKVGNIVNALDRRVKVAVLSIKQPATRAIVRIKNFTKKLRK